MPTGYALVRASAPCIGSDPSALALHHAAIRLDPVSGMNPPSDTLEIMLAPGSSG